MKKANHDLLVGRTIAGKYVVETLIGSGAMGAVFRARQISLEKTVAAARTIGYFRSTRGSTSM